MLSAAAPLIGALITVMNVLNGLFSARVGNLVSTLVIHAVGLSALCLILLLYREARPGGRVPYYLYTGGLFGVATVFSLNYAFGNLDASLAVALALFGQLAFSLLIDAIGILGRKRYPPTWRNLPGLALAVGGVAVMAGIGGGGGSLPALALVLALVGGALPLASFTMNSTLGARIGVLRSARTNYLVGLAATLLILVAVRPPLGDSPAAVLGSGPLLILSGGLLGILVVAGTNIIFPRLPALTSTLLMFAGQSFAGLAMDAILGRGIALSRVLGSLILLAGLAANALAPRIAPAAGGSREA